MPSKFAEVEFRHLRTFCAVARHLSFSRAADDLHVAQPALSRQIKDLESFIDVKLFDRNRSHVRLTAAGKIFEAQVQRVLAQLDIAITAAQQTPDKAVCELFVGSDFRFTHPLITQAIITLKKKFPDIEVHLTDLTMAEQISALKEGRINIGFVPPRRMSSSDNLALVPFATTRIFAIVNAAHPLAHQSKVSLAQLRDETWLMIDSSDSNSYRSFLLRLCKEMCGFIPRSIRRAKSREAVFTLIALGQGISLFPEHIAPRDNPNIKAIPISDLRSVDLCVVHPRSFKSRALDAFLQVIKSLRA